MFCERLSCDIPWPLCQMLELTIPIMSAEEMDQLHMMIALHYIIRDIGKLLDQTFKKLKTIEPFDIAIGNAISLYKMRKGDMEFHVDSNRGIPPLQIISQLPKNHNLDQTLILRGYITFFIYYPDQEIFLRPFPILDYISKYNEYYPLIRTLIHYFPKEKIKFINKGNVCLSSVIMFEFYNKKLRIHIDRQYKFTIEVGFYPEIFVDLIKSLMEFVITMLIINNPNFHDDFDPSTIQLQEI